MCYQRTEKERNDEQEARKGELPRTPEPPASRGEPESKDVREREAEPAAV